MVTAVDTSVLLDVLLNDPQHAAASIAFLRRASFEGSLILCEIVLAELAPTLAAADMPQFLSDWKIAFVPSSQSALLLPVKCFEVICSAEVNSKGLCRTF